MSCDPGVPKEMHPEAKRAYQSPSEHEEELAVDLRLIECRAASLVKHVMRVRHRLELRGVARSTAYWTAYVLGQDGGVIPWCE